MLVIVLVALLCTLVAAFALHSAIQCALRCCRSSSSRRGEEAADTTGLKKKALGRIPVAEYGQGVVDLPTSMECSICLAEFADGERVRVLPKCNHGFHVGCIDTWLAAHSSCPTCRHSLLPSLAEEGHACWRFFGRQAMVEIQRPQV